MFYVVILILAVVGAYFVYKHFAPAAEAAATKEVAAVEGGVASAESAVKSEVAKV